MIHQSGLASPGWGRKPRWREMRRSELVTVPSFSPQPVAGEARRRRPSCRCRGAVGYDDEGAGGQRPVDPVGVGQADGGVGRHDPERLDLSGLDRLEQIDGLQALSARHARRLPEAADAVDGVRGETHMGGELVGEPADLAPAHGVGLAGDRERPHAGPADPAGGEMAVDDGVDLVGAARRLVDALANRRSRSPPCRRTARRIPGSRQGSGRSRGNRVHVAGVVAGGQECFCEAVGVGGDEILVHRARRGPDGPASR